MRTSFWVTILALWTGTSGALLGQVNTATVTGAVTDATGASIPIAKIDVKNEATGVTSATVTNGAGRFSLPFLPIGSYTISVTAKGFAGQSKSGVDLTAGQMLDLKFALAVGNIQQNVTVAAESTSLSYDTA